MMLTALLQLLAGEELSRIELASRSAGEPGGAAIPPPAAAAVFLASVMLRSSVVAVLSWSRPPAAPTLLVFCAMVAVSSRRVPELEIPAPLLLAVLSATVDWTRDMA